MQTLAKQYGDADDGGFSDTPDPVWVLHEKIPPDPLHVDHERLVVLGVS